MNKIVKTVGLLLAGIALTAGTTAYAAPRHRGAGPRLAPIHRRALPPPRPRPHHHAPVVVHEYRECGGEGLVAGLLGGLVGGLVGALVN